MKFKTQVWILAPALIILGVISIATTIMLPANTTFQVVITWFLRFGSVFAFVWAACGFYLAYRIEAADQADGEGA